MRPALRLAPLVLVLPIAADTPGQPPTEALLRGEPAATAKTCAERAIALGRVKAEAQVLRGRALAAGGNRGEAEEAFTLAMHLAPREPETFTGIARGYLRLGDRRAAQAALDAAEATHPMSPAPCRLAAQVWREIGDLEPVRPLAEKALRFAAKDAAAAAEFAVDLLDMGLAKEAFAIMEVAHPREPKDWEICTAFATACLRARRPKDAELWFQRGILARPKEAKPRRAMIEGYVEHGTREDCAAARTALQDALERAFPPKERDSQALALMGHLHLLLGERDKAEGRFRESVMHKDAGAEAFRLIGHAWMKAGFEAEALRAYEVVATGKGTGSFMGIGPGGIWGIDFAKLNRKQALMDAAQDLAAQGYKEKALALAEEAYLLGPEDFENMVALGKVCLQKGWQAEGARFLALGGRKGFQDRDYWVAAGNALLDTLPSPAAPRP
ncbi:MAG TPA: hypothetical protein VJ570_00885 [Holophagaceae bacterium]|nr:hypothetical protein [Holophagaceae bacterium]